MADYQAGGDYEYGPGKASIMQMFEDVLGKDAKWRKLPNDHPIYHSFFDFDNGPPPNTSSAGAGGLMRFSSYLEGLFLDGRLVAIRSDIGFAGSWQSGIYGQVGNEAYLKMGVNIVIYALTQPGSIAQQQIDFYRQADF